MKRRPITIKTYYQAFKSLSGVLAGIFSAIPLISKVVLPGAFTAYGFPPLGSAEGPARVGSAIFALATTYFAFFARGIGHESFRRRVRVAIVCGLIFLFTYIALLTLFVRTIEIPSRGTSVQISVGLERTEFARANFGGESDWEILRDRGTDEEQVWKLWTPQSLLFCRLSLYIAYCLCLLSLVAAFSWGVLSELEESNAGTNCIQERPEERETT